MQESVLKALEEFLVQASGNALFPIVGYGLDGDNILLLTTNIPDLPYAMRILKETTGKDYNLGYSFCRNVIAQLAERNPNVMRFHERAIQGLHLEKLVELGRVVSIFGAPFFKLKAFALVDICGFSQLGHAEQLSQLYGLTNALGSSIRRAHKFCRRLGLSFGFGRTSTGDGFYLWHDWVGGLLPRI